MTAMEQKTLLKALIDAGLGARRQLAAAIREGKVTVNGELINNYSHLVNTGRDIIRFDKKHVNLQPVDKIVIMLNKPLGIISTTSDESGRETALDMIPTKYRTLKLYPAGRLDKESSGLLLLTNDGEFTYKLTHPKFEHEKEYLVITKIRLTRQDIELLQNGIELEDGRTSPAIINEIKGRNGFEYSITIHEGRNRQIRRMFARLGINVVSLRRIRIGGLRLGDLKQGESRVLNASEIRKLFQKH